MAYMCKRYGNMECDGCGACKPEQQAYYCPICSSKVTETVYVSDNGDVIGCENCVSTKEPWEVMEDEIEW